MGKRRRRRLGPEERRLWERVAATTSPLHPSAPSPSAASPSAQSFAVGSSLHDRSTALTPPPAPEPTRRRPDAAGPAPTRPAGTPSRPTASVSYAPPEAAPVGRPQAGLDRRTAERLRRGARDPDARIDLHGMTAERAHRACLRFLADAAAQGHRVVLVITGKGRRDEHGHVSGRGVLRDSLPGWLRASPLGHSVVGIYQAHRRHGGEGAFYVYLKRRR